MFCFSVFVSAAAAAVTSAMYIPLSAAAAAIHVYPRAAEATAADRGIYNAAATAAAALTNTEKQRLKHKRKLNFLIYSN